MTAGTAEEFPISPFRKGVNLVAVFVVIVINVGIPFYSTSVYLAVLPEQRGFGVGIVALGATLSSLAGAVAGLFVARMLRRLSGKTIVLLGSIGIAIGFIGLGLADQSWMMLLAYLAIGAMGAVAGLITLTDLIARTFRPNPTTPIMVASSGSSVAGAMLPPVLLVLLDGAGVALGSGVVAAVVIGINLLAVLVIKEPPRAVGAARNVPEEALATETGPRPRLAWLRRLRLEPVLVLLMIGFGLLVFSQNASSVHMLLIGAERGIPNAAIALSVIAASSLICRFLGILVLTRISIRWFALGVAALQAISQFVLAFATDLTGLIIGSALLGVTVGNAFVMSSLFVLEGFPLSRYPGAYGAVNLAMMMGSATAPLGIALFAQWSGGYLWPLIAVGIGSAIGGACIVATGITSVPSRRRKAEAKASEQAVEVGRDA